MLSIVSLYCVVFFCIVLLCCLVVYHVICQYGVNPASAYILSNELLYPTQLMREMYVHLRI